jgi:hypothetical protein
MLITLLMMLLAINVLHAQPDSPETVALAFLHILARCPVLHSAGLARLLMEVTNH